jgi:uncharacterized RmlC-like cupin family protein
MCFSFWGVPRGDSRLTNQIATWLVYLRGVSISPGKTPKAKRHSVHETSVYYFSALENQKNSYIKGVADDQFIATLIILI